MTTSTVPTDARNARLELLGRDPYMRVCPSWCSDREQGHVNELHHDDRRHWSTFHELEQLELPQARDRSPDVGLTVCMCQHYRAELAEVRVDVGGVEVLRLTTAEALWLQEVLGRLLEEDIRA